MNELLVNFKANYDYLQEYMQLSSTVYIMNNDQANIIRKSRKCSQYFVANNLPISVTIKKVDYS